MAGQRTSTVNLLPARAAMVASLATLILLVFMAGSLLLAGPAAAVPDQPGTETGTSEPSEPGPVATPPVASPPSNPPVDPPPSYAPVEPPVDPAPLPAAPEQPVDAPAENSPAPVDPELIPADDPAPVEAPVELPASSQAATPSATPTPAATPSAATAPLAPGNVDSDKASVTSDIPVTPRWLQVAVIVLLLAMGWAYARFMRRGSRHLNSATASEETK